jgi:opine dehydrogenase
MDPKKIAVIGAGNGGFAMAADLTLAGFDIHLYELPKFESNIKPVIERGGIEITGAARTGFARFGLMTTDIKKAIEDCFAIMVVTQALVHEELAHWLAPVIKPGQCIFLAPGSGGAILFGKIFHEERISSKVGIAEVLMLPYGCRKTSPTSINVSRLLGVLGVGAFPGKDIDWVFPTFQKIYPKCFKMSSALEVGVCNANIILHPGPTLLNAGRIEYSGGDFSLYREGMTPSIMRIIDALDQEIASIFGTLQFPSQSSKKLFEKRFEKKWDEQLDFMRRVGSKGPFDLNTRYITEDVPIGMVLISSLGELLGIPTPTFDSIIHMCGVIHKRDYWKEGRTISKIGLDGMSVQDLKRFLKEGYE